MAKLISRITMGFFFILLLIVLFPASASAATISIDGTTRDFNSGETLQEAVVGAPAGSNVTVTIPAGETLVGIEGGARHYETFPSSLGSITFTGGGTFSPTVGSGSNNLYMYFHGVPVTLDNITFIGTVYGGTPGGTNNQGALSSTSVVVNNAAITTGLVGGSVISDVGTVSIAIAGPQSQIGNGNVFGGNRGDSLYPTTGGTVDAVSIAITGGTFGYIYGGGQANSQTTQTAIAMTGGTADYVFGGAPASDGFVGNANVSLSGNAHVNVNVFGGGEGSSLTGETHVTISGGSVGNSVYAGGHTSTVGLGEVIIAGGVVASRVSAGGFGGLVEEGSVLISSGSVGRVYGGGHNGGTVENAQVSIIGGPYSIADISTGGTSLGLVQNSRVVISAGINDVNTLTVEPNHTLLLEEGSQMTTLGTATINNEGTTITHGPIVSNGTLSNNGVIVLSSDGSLAVNGTREGTGVILPRQISPATNGQTFILNGSENLVINETSGTPDQIDFIEIDGLILDEASFTASLAAEGIDITVDREFLNTLEPGEHSIRIVFFDTSHTEGVFTVAPAPIEPEPEPETPSTPSTPDDPDTEKKVDGELAPTGDNNAFLIAGALLALSVIVFLAASIRTKEVF